MAILGIDLGSKRVGIAVSESMLIASAHSVIRNPGSVAELVERLAILGEQLHVDEYVVGIPRTRRRDAEETERKFRQFADVLKQTSGRPVVLWDESLTTVAATEQMRAAGRNRKQMAERIDMEAARVILQSYLDERNRSRP